MFERVCKTGLVGKAMSLACRTYLLHAMTIHCCSAFRLSGKGRRVDERGTRADGMNEAAGSGLLALLSVGFLFGHERVDGAFGGFVLRYVMCSPVLGVEIADIAEVASILRRLSTHRIQQMRPLGVHSTTLSGCQT